MEPADDTLEHVSLVAKYPVASLPLKISEVFEKTGENVSEHLTRLAISCRT